MMNKKKVISVSGSVLIVLGLAACGGAQATSEGSVEKDFPSKNMTLVVPYSPGGSTDVGARLMAEALEEKLDTTIVVENREGAGGQVGFTSLANAKCDGYTFGHVNLPPVIVSALDETRGASYDRDSFAPVALQVIDPTAIVVAKDSPYKSIDDLVQAAKDNPGKIRYTTTGVGTDEHFAMLAAEKSMGVDFSPVHFSDGGGSPKTAFLGGELEIYVANVSDVADMAENDQGRVLGVMTAERSPFLPEIPTFQESGYDVEMASSRGYAFPECVPAEIVDKVSTAVGSVMEDEAFLEKMKNLGLAPSYKDSAEFSEYWDKTSDLFEKLVPSVRDDA